MNSPRPQLVSSRDPETSEASQELKNALRTSAIISRIADEPLPPMRRSRAFLGVVPMAEPASAAAGGILLKLLPAGVGAGLMVMVDPPKSRRELFARIFVAFVSTYLFGDVVFDGLHSLGWFAFLDVTKRAHTVAIDSMVGAVGWFILGGVSMWLKKFRGDPVAAVHEAKDA